ncbi:hypothetical protein AGRA3207_000410 [Actinomadura graeca]|uniref:Uncharacterized protein n=1 Tax=Actinomadura graeca TaxID=2750812 RepID=A0ABX8QM72_9ACTN|nr:hypothetical protein [Actinomadura graeca]QXJ19814.1 hypothetical protein AGRA3207_000410 [Actinomadura graeca]
MGTRTGTNRGGPGGPAARRYIHGCSGGESRRLGGYTFAKGAAVNPAPLPHGGAR